MRSFLTTLLGVCLFLMLQPVGPTCTTTPCAAMGQLQFEIRDREACVSASAQVVSPNMFVSNMTHLCKQPFGVTLRITKMLAVQIDTAFKDGTGLAFFTNTGNPWTTPYDVAAKGSRIGELRVTFPANAPPGKRLFKVTVNAMSTSFPFETYSATRTCAITLVTCKFKVHVATDGFGEPIRKLQAGSSTRYSFDLTNETAQPLPLTWRATSTQRASAFVGYSADTGASTGASGTPGGGTTAWLQRCEARNGADAVTSVEVAYGSPAQPASAPPAGSRVRVAVWEDPNDDGHPADAVLLADVQTVVSSPAQDVFESIPMPPGTAVSGVFFVGAYMSHAAGVEPAARDASRISDGEAWLTGSSGPAAFDPQNLAGNNVPLVELDQAMQPAVWLLRANSTQHNDHFPIALGGNPIPNGNPASTIPPVLSGMVQIPPGPGTTLTVDIDTRSYKGCHEGSTGELEFVVSDPASGEETVTTAYYFVGGPGWSGLPDGTSLTHVTTYCTAKRNSLGCTPSMGWLGEPNLSNAVGFCIQASEVRNNKAGLLLYSVNGKAATPFQGGTLCLKTPVKRTPGTSSGGTPPPSNDCSGLYSLDMNAFAAGLLGGNPSPALLALGQAVQCQWWGRDQGFPPPDNTTLSDGLEYVVAP
jgi:hypothetical protein